MKKIVLALTALLAVAAPIAATAAPADAATSHSCTSVRQWNKVRPGMSPTRVMGLLHTPARLDGGVDWFGPGTGLMVKKYDVCGPHGHGFVTYYKDPGTGWYAHTINLYRYL